MIPLESDHEGKERETDATVEIYGGLSENDSDKILRVRKKKDILARTSSFSG